MGLMDSLMGAAGKMASEKLMGAGAGGMDGQQVMGLVNQLLNQAGGVSGLVQKLQSGGLGEAVQSWIGTGGNQAVSADQLGSALGPELLGNLRSQLGDQSDQALGGMANLLPQLIDKLSPGGQLPANAGNDLASLFGGGEGVAGLLGGLLKK